MLCPYCQNRLRAGAPECPSCRLTFPRTSSLLGATPRLNPIVADTVFVLRPAEITKIRKRVAQLYWRFPQLTLQVILLECPPPHPLRLHAFWLFNAGAFASESKRGRNNHAILLTIDPSRAEAAIMPGYGLEELLRPEDLGHLLSTAGLEWEEKRWAAGILQVLDGLDQLLEICAIPDGGHSPAAADF
ncbi:hypothetical protein JIN85_03420 [Luteolibacter pohnpeiensis]|uniref:TPM domain-containing protein n=1 Tax=Luteolibacter pohnpeiensis TaxID=454153 RepID=A0A934VVE5_9BACT|nr:hypothetical protein [Luteolibacter pohnpeiensis]MBK1881449.1 hypothetical protein [Luteolibacter pohnpeiensis]